MARDFVPPPGRDGGLNEAVELLVTMVARAGSRAAPSGGKGGVTGKLEGRDLGGEVSRMAGEFMAAPRRGRSGERAV